MDSKKLNNNPSQLSSLLREVVFGIEDGVVSTLGAVTGIAAGSGDRYTVLLAGIVIIAVESISMGIGSYISNYSSKQAEDKIVDDEKEELKKYPEEEKRELYLMFLRDGWNRNMASKMAKSASYNSKLMLKEHEYRELGIFPYQEKTPLKNGIFMFFSYILGGLFPLTVYFLLPIASAIYVSVIVSLTGLFLLGAVTTIYTNANVIRSGLRLVIMGGIAFAIGLIVGETASFIK